MLDFGKKSESYRTKATTEMVHPFVLILPSSTEHLVGYWSAGTRLADGARVSGQGHDTGTLPEYMVIFLYSQTFLSNA